MSSLGQMSLVYAMQLAGGLAGGLAEHHHP